MVLVVMTLSLVSCGTVQGVGSDISWLGRVCGDMIENE